MDWFAADTFLHGGRDKTSRPIENNTRVLRLDDDTIGIKLHDTVVVKIRRDSWQLFTGGWYTVTTKDRLNSYSPARIASDRGRWFVYKPGDWDTRVPFFDGIAVDRDGNVLNPPQNTLHEERERKRIETDLADFTKGFIKELREGTLGLPDNGDCWYCFGILPGDNIDHLRSHISKDERYYVPSLLFNAVKERGYGSWQFVMQLRLDMDAYNAGKLKLRDPRDGREFARDLRRYLKKRLLPGGGVTPIGVPISRGGYA